MNGIQERAIRFLRWSEKYTKTDMVYLASGGFWLGLEQASAILFSLGLAVLFGHFVSQDTYGNYKYILNVSGLLGIFSLSGLGTAVTRGAARGDEGSLSQGFALNLRWGSGIVIAGFLASAYYFIIGNTFAGVAFAFSAVTLPFINGFSLYDPFLTGLRKFRLDSLFTIGSLAFTTASLAITLLFFSQRAIVLVVVYLVTNLASDALWYFLSLRKASNSKTNPEMPNYGFHLSVMNVIGSIANQIDSVVVFTLLGPAQLAVYAYAIAIPEQIKGLAKNIAPLSISKFSQRSIAEIRITIWKRVALLTFFLVLCIALYILLAPVIFRVLFPIYSGSVLFSRVYAISILVAFTVPITTIFQAHKKTRELYITSGISSVVLIITLPILTYFWGIWGAIASQIMYRAITSVLVVWQLFTLDE